MKAVQFAKYGGPEVLQVYEVPDPSAGPADVLIEVKATTVNHLDLFQRAGSRPVGKLPFTPGLEAAGVVLSDNVGFRKGERVLTTRAITAKGGGGYASRIAVPATDLVRIPGEVSFEEAVAAGLTASTAWNGLFDVGHLRAGAGTDPSDPALTRSADAPSIHRGATSAASKEAWGASTEDAGQTKGEHVLIWAGSSGVGSLAIQLAKYAGAWVATTVSNEEKAKEMQRLGADLVVNHRQQDVGQVVHDAGGVDLVIELVSTSLQASLEACKDDARIVIVGNLGGQQATVDTQAWRLKRTRVIGGGSSMRTSVENERRILELIGQKVITPVIARKMPIGQAEEAHRLLASGELIGKIVLVHS